jgi:hypothetical protein
LIGHTTSNPFLDGGVVVVVVVVVMVVGIIVVEVSVVTPVQE